MTTTDEAVNDQGDRPLQGNTDKAVDFLKQWYGADTRSIVTIHPETGETLRHDFQLQHELQDEAAMRAHIEAAQGRLNVHFVANACKTPWPGTTTPPRKEEMYGGRCLHLDADNCGVEELLARIRSFDPPPSVIVFTGDGYQAAWLYDATRAPWLYGGTFAGKDWADRTEAANAAIARAIGAAPGSHNVNRLLRLPGTVIVPSAAKRKAQPALAYLVKADWELRWSFEALPDSLVRVRRLPERA